MPLPLDSAHPQATALRERHIYFVRGRYLFELLYAAPEAHYPRWLVALATLVQTFSFADAAPGAIFRPLVAADSLHALRDEGKNHDNTRHGATVA